MELSQVLTPMREGKKARRTDWGYPQCTYITMEKFRGVWHFFMNHQYEDDTENKSKIGYGLTFPDIDADTWEIID